MKGFTRCWSIKVLCCFLVFTMPFYSVPLFAETPSDEESRASESMTADSIQRGVGTSPGIKPRAIRPPIVRPPIKLPAPLVISRFKQLRKSDPNIKTLDAFLVNKGFKAQTGNANFGGSKSFLSGRGTTGEAGTVQSELVIQDFKNPGTGEQGALLQLVVRAAGKLGIPPIGIQEENARDIQSAKYSFVLIGDPKSENVVEFTVEGGVVKEVVPDVVRGHCGGWWCCFKERVKEKCPSTCISALTTCPTTSWPIYIACVIARCGGCVTKAMLCCSCDCRWWCKWGVGCCNK